MTLVNIYINILIILPFMVLMYIIIYPTVKYLRLNLTEKLFPKPRKTYSISFKKHKNFNVSSITCLKCGRTSYNPKDVEHLYCGNCKQFHHRF